MKLRKLTGVVVASAIIFNIATTTAKASVGWQEGDYYYVQSLEAVSRELTPEKEQELLDIAIFDQHGEASGVKPQYIDDLRTGNIELTSAKDLEMQFDEDIVDDKIANGTKFIVMGKDLGGEEYTSLCVAIEFKLGHVVLYDIVRKGTVAINASNMSSFYVNGLHYASEAISNTTYVNSADVIYEIDRSITYNMTVEDILGMLADGTINFDNLRVVDEFIDSVDRSFQLK